MLLIYVYMSVESAPNNFKVYFKKCELQLSIFKNYFTTDVIFIYCLLYSKLWNIEIFLIKTNKMLVSDRNKYMKCLGWSTTIFIFIFLLYLETRTVCSLALNINYFSSLKVALITSMSAKRKPIINQKNCYEGMWVILHNSCFVQIITF